MSIIERSTLAMIDLLDATPTLMADELNSKDKSGKTMLCHCAANNYLAVVERLRLIPDVDPNIADNEGNTPLIHSAQAGHSEMVRMLINGFPTLDINQTNEHGFTALMKAAIQGRTLCARQLLKAGADALRRDRGRGLCALEWAEYVGRIDCARTIAQFMLAASEDMNGLALSPRDRSSTIVMCAERLANSEDGRLSARSRKSKVYHSRSSGAVDTLRHFARIFTIPLMPDVGESAVRPRLRSAERMRPIPKVHITLTSKDDNYFIERPKIIGGGAGSSRQKQRRQKGSSPVRCRSSHR